MTQRGKKPLTDNQRRLLSYVYGKPTKAVSILAAKDFLIMESLFRRGLVHKRGFASYTLTEEGIAAAQKINNS